MEFFNGLLEALGRLQNIFSRQMLDKDWKSSCKALVSEARENSRILIMGEFKAGKSTFLNALLGQEILTSDITPATAVATVLKYGQVATLEAVTKTGETLLFDMDMLQALSAEGDAEAAALRAELDYLVVRLPIDLLNRITLVDTPGLNSIYEHHTQATHRFLKQADDVIWLFRYGMIGKRTEIESIEQIKEYGIVPLGIVNAVDLHYEQTDEDVEVLLQKEYRKLHTYVRELIGVSAIDALEGKLERDAEKLEWSNFGELNARIDQMEQIKLRRTLVAITAFLEGFVEQLDTHAVQDGLYVRRECIFDFLNDKVPVLQEEQEQLYMQIAHISRKSKVLNMKEASHLTAEAFIKKLKSKDLHTYKEYEKSLQLYRSYTRLHDNNVAEFDKKKAELIHMHTMAVGRGLGRVKQLTVSKSKLNGIREGLVELESIQAHCEVSRKSILNYQIKLKDNWDQHTKQLELEINKRKQQYSQEALRLYDDFQNRKVQEAENFKEDYETLQRYSFVQPLIALLEEMLLRTAEAANTSHSYYIQRFSQSLTAILARLREYDMTAYVSEFEQAVAALKSDHSQPAVESKLPYPLVADELCRLSQLEDQPHIPNMIHLNTFYYRPLVIMLLLAGGAFSIYTYNPGLTAELADKAKAIWQQEADDPAETTSAPIVEDESIGTAEVVANELNIRSGPSIDAPVVNTAWKGSTFKVFLEQDGWLKIGENEWISGKEQYVSFVLKDE